MTRFQLHDTVALRIDRSFVGSIDRTSHSEPEPLDDCLIIAHAPVPDDRLHEFINSGCPPAGYVFVQFASQEKGSALVAEIDLLLLDRLFDLGDVVKEEGSHLTGTVVNVSSTYVLEPVWRPKLSNDGFAAESVNENRLSFQHICSRRCSALDWRISHPFPSHLIHDVPFEELKRAQDFIEGDYVIEQDWLGLVDSIEEFSVIVKLEDNSMVVVADSQELFIPIPDYGKPLVSLPEFDGILRPHYVSAMQGWGNTIPPEDLECGQFVVTNHRNLRDGRWLRGSYNPNVRPEGRVLMVRCRRLGVQWLMCNAFTPEHHWNAKRPEICLPYENLTTFPAPQEIRRDKKLVLYDPSKHVLSTQDRTRGRQTLGQVADVVDDDAPEPSAGTGTGTTTPSEYRDNVKTHLSSNFSVGQQVKFRDPAGAAVKYQGKEVAGVVHGRFERILHGETFGYDLNELQIVHSMQKSTVRWQNGTISELPSTSLRKTDLFEADLMPADIVVAREGMKQRHTPFGFGDPTPLVDFNEMTLFEKPHDLLPAKVGIIQSVSPHDRIASIRWYEEAKIRIAQSGNALGPESRFGPIGKQVEDVSLYEVMAFPGLIRKIRDLVILQPSIISRQALDAMEEISEDDMKEVDASITTLSQIQDRQDMTLLEWMQHNASRAMDSTQIPKVVDANHYRSHVSIDWVGEICQLQPNGIVVVRVNIGDQARDVLLEHDQILAFIDEQIWGMDYNADPMDMDSSVQSVTSSMTSDPEEAFEEVVEYEGGQRVDDDAGDENWESESDSHGEVDAQSRPAIVAGTDTDGRRTPARLHTNINTNDPSLGSLETENNPLNRLPDTSLTGFLPSEAPPPFLVLDCDPPADQFNSSNPPLKSTNFLKRIAKEHRMLSTSLPANQIFVRTYSSRLDLLRCLIIGPVDTPYEHAPFLVDLDLRHPYPQQPPVAHFHSWTSGMGRINPNLYEEGKICLSLLGTWPGRSDTESWTEKATILQLLVSLQGLVFVKSPFYNEAGFEGREATNEYTTESLQYSEKAYVMGRNFIKHALSSPVAGLEDVLAYMYLKEGILKSVITRSKALISSSENIKDRSDSTNEPGEADVLLSGDGSTGDETGTFLRPLSKGALVMLRKTMRVLEEILQQYQTPGDKVE